jgi:hypothetical protein
MEIQLHEPRARQKALGRGRSSIIPQTNKDLATAAQSFELHLRHAVGSQKQSQKEQTRQKTRENQEPKGGRGDFTRSTNLQPVANRFVAPQRVSHEKKIKGT